MSDLVGLLNSCIHYFNILGIQSTLMSIHQNTCKYGHMKQFYGFRSYLKELDDGHVQTLLNSLRRSVLCKEMGKIGNNNSRQ